jgi:uncharacterized membrane protein YccC
MHADGLIPVHYFSKYLWSAWRSYFTFLVIFIVYFVVQVLHFALQYWVILMAGVSNQLDATFNLIFVGLVVIVLVGCFIRNVLFFRICATAG